MKTLDKSYNEKACMSNVPSETILSFLPHLGIHQEDIQWKNIMSVGEGIPFLANSLSSMWAIVVAVDPLYKGSPWDIYDNKLSHIKTSAIGILLSLFWNDASPFRQLKKLQNVIDNWKDNFVKSFFDDTTTQFNDSFADNINVENWSQDFVILSFLLNNLKTKDNVFDAIVESINKLKKWWKLIIIWPDDSALTRSELDTLKKRYSFKEYVYDDNTYIYRAYSFLKK